MNKYTVITVERKLPHLRCKKENSYKKKDCGNLAFEVPHILDNPNQNRNQEQRFVTIATNYSLESNQWKAVSNW